MPRRRCERSSFQNPQRVDLHWNVKTTIARLASPRVSEPSTGRSSLELALRALSPSYFAVSEPSTGRSSLELAPIAPKRYNSSGFRTLNGSIFIGTVTQRRVVSQLLLFQNPQRVDLHWNSDKLTEQLAALRVFQNPQRVDLHWNREQFSAQKGQICYKLLTIASMTYCRCIPF